MLSVLVWFGLRELAQPWFGLKVPYLQFYPAVLIAAWYGGFGPGVVATVLSAVLAAYFYLPPIGLAIADPVDWISLAIFIATGVAIAALNRRIRSAEASRAETAHVATARAERLNAIINTTVDAIIVIDSSGAIEEFNAGAERLFGYPAAEVIGRNVSMLMPSPDHEQHDNYLRQYQRTGEANVIGVGRQVRGRRRDGSTFPLHLSVGEMWIDGVRKFTGMLHDLTTRVELEEQLRRSEGRWRAIVQSAVDGIIVINAQGAIEAFNPAAEGLFGYPEREVLGRNVNMLMPAPYHAHHDQYLSDYMTTGHAKIIGVGREVTGLRRDGTTFPLHLSVGEILIEGERKFTGIVHDLSARLRLEAQLRDQAGLARLGEMAAVLAHEIKNPLAGIRGAMEVVRDGLPADFKNADLLHDGIARIDALDRLMRELLLFARPPRPNRVAVDVGPLVATTARLFQSDPELREISVDVHGAAPPVAADPQMLEHVFHNLLINGAHAMNGRGAIRVDVAAADGHCQVSFTDSGGGIPSDMRERVFSPFFTTKTRGSGLGLPTAKRFIEAHHGQIWIDSSGGDGTTMVVRLPFAEPPAADHA